MKPAEKSRYIKRKIKVYRDINKINLIRVKIEKSPPLIKPNVIKHTRTLIGFCFTVRTTFIHEEQEQPLVWFGKLSMLLCRHCLIRDQVKQKNMTAAIALTTTERGNAKKSILFLAYI